VPKASSKPWTWTFVGMILTVKMESWLSRSSTWRSFRLLLVRLSFREQEELAIEVVMLGHEVLASRRQVARASLRAPDRAVLAGFSRLLSAAALLREAETLVRWHRDLVRPRWTKSHSGPGRPGVRPGTVSLVAPNSRGRIPLGATGASTASSPQWASGLRLRASWPSCHAIISSPRRDDPGRPGWSS